ncbi:UPF0553 protein C9orf64 [Hypsibius exemplaris]|uniref:Queuosine 5'-phosphate N-glycosylase/hydrolase n=1 Tax=Hypsibius exemplaris TaxID=2072580 RepID=A0A9X6NES0_HYPEX|nr:UPF0553 protein C9orf64 [Hypsibius exemplaris]
MVQPSSSANGDVDVARSPADLPLSGSPSSRVRHSAKFIASASDSVAIHLDAVAKLAQLLVTHSRCGEMGLDRWKKHELHPKSGDQAAVDWIFVADTLNFSFWSEVEDVTSPEKYAVEYRGKRYTGYWSCCAAINRAIDEGIPILDARYLASITDAQVSHIFRASGKGEMPMLAERRANLQEAGKVLVEKYGGTFLNAIRAAGNSSQKLLETILNDFPSYRDTGTFKGEKVEFYKRAQILVADVWACFEGEGFGMFTDIDQLTIFADYRIPQVLNYFGTMTYSPELQKKLDANYMFQYGEHEEEEIRGCTIHVSELLKNELNRLIKTAGANAPDQPEVNAIVLDHYLWDYRQLHNDDMKHTPYHKVRCIYY